MADVTFNIAKGWVAYYASLPAANDALLAVPFEAAGLDTDAALIDCVSLNAIHTGPSNLQAVMGRKVLTGVTVTPNYTDDRVEVDAVDPVWAAASGNAVGCLVICYDPDTTSGDDSSIVPLVKLDWSVTPAGADVTATFPTAGFYWAT